MPLWVLMMYNLYSQLSFSNTIVLGRITCNHTFLRFALTVIVKFCSVDYRSSYPDFEEQGMSVAAAGGAAGGGDGEQEEEEVDQEVLDQTNFQLVLPSG